MVRAPVVTAVIPESEDEGGYGGSGYGPPGAPESALPPGWGDEGEYAGPSSNSQGGSMPNIEGEDRAGSNQRTAAVAPIPDDVPDGRDDDIVARQLREAAMQEKDPVLREKLWAEYKKYKNGQ